MKTLDTFKGIEAEAQTLKALVHYVQQENKEIRVLNVHRLNRIESDIIGIKNLVHSKAVNKVNILNGDLSSFQETSHGIMDNINQQI